jgi:hypothetical protein
MKKASEYRTHAAECRTMMVNATADEQKAMLETMARTWDTLAQDRERQVIQQKRITKLEKDAEGRTETS